MGGDRWAWQWQMSMEVTGGQDRKLMSGRLKHGINHPDGCHMSTSAGNVAECYLALRRDLGLSMRSLEYLMWWIILLGTSDLPGYVQPTGNHDSTPLTGEHRAEMPEVSERHSFNLMGVGVSVVSARGRGRDSNRWRWHERWGWNAKDINTLP